MIRSTETIKRQRAATQNAIKHIAYVMANQGIGKRQKAAIAHCAELGIDHSAETFELALA